MQFAIIENNQILKVDELSNLFPNTLFPASGPDQEWLAENNAVEVTYFKPHDNSTEKLIPTEPYFENQQVYMVAVVPKTEADFVVNTMPVIRVSMRQARIALLNAGLLTTVESIIANIGDILDTNTGSGGDTAATTISGDAIRITWEYATEVERHNPLVAKLQSELNWSDAEVDALFAAASLL